MQSFNQSFNKIPVNEEEFRNLKGELFSNKPSYDAFLFENLVVEPNEQNKELIGLRKWRINTETPNAVIFKLIVVCVITILIS